MTSHPTRAALHSAAVTLLEQHGEDGVTVEMVLTCAGASKGSLYHHYRDFGTLLDDAQATRFAAAVDGTIAALGAAPAGTREDLVATLVGLASCASSPYDDAVRVAVLAAAVRRPSLLPLLEPAQRRLTETVAALVRDGQSRHWIRRDVDAGQLALLLEAGAAGQVVGAVSGAVPAEWQQTIDPVLRAAMSTVPPHGPAIPEGRAGNAPAPRT